MIITEKFVYIHLPKTGGTFVTRMIRELYNTQNVTLSKIRFFLNPKTGKPYYINLRKKQAKHAGCRQIPPAQRHKPIVSSFRNPFDRYVSQYEYGWWRTRPHFFYLYNSISEVCPHYPDLSFSEFVKLRNGDFVEELQDRGNGFQTLQFCHFFSRTADITSTLDRDDDDSVFDEVRNSLYDVEFLRTHRLNKDLYNFLHSQDYEKSRISYILDQEKIYPKGSTRRKSDWRSYYDDDLLRYVARKERFLLRLFPEFDPD